MKKSSITLIIILLSVSLIGILVLQGLWINNAWKAKQEDFHRSVKDALNKVVLTLEKREAFRYITERYTFSDRSVFIEQRSSSSSSHTISGDSAIVMSKQGGSIRHFNVIKPDTGGEMIRILSSPDTGLDQRTSSDQISGMILRDTGTNRLYDKRVNVKVNQINDIIYEMISEWSSVSLPIEKRISPRQLYGLIQGEFEKKGIDLPFQFAVTISGHDSLCNVKSSSFNASMIPASFNTELFPNDIFLSPYRLLVHFNDMRPYFIKSLWWMLVLSALFSLMIIATFATAVYVILRQKKVSEIKTDFINNMTHEFKTPIATISVALDAINNPKVLDDKGRIRYYSDIISRENKRMNSHVEQILQVALLDKETLELNEQLLDVHEIINRVADAILVQVENRNGHLTLDLKASDPLVLADEIHMTNIVYNLLDNANKYSTNTPEISVSTSDEKSGIVISVEDRGIGMTSETQRKIFKKFYRAQSGNVHNVKGFGLGLAYVKAIVKKLGGNIRVKSEPGKGSRFEIYLPSGHHQYTGNNAG